MLTDVATHPFVFGESIELIGSSGAKQFVKDGNTINYQTVHVRDKGQVLELKADPTFDFTSFVGKEVTLVFEIRKGSFVRVLGCQ